MRILIVRLGGIGDCLIVTPLIKYLYEQGNEIYFLTSEQGMEIYKNNPHITKLHLHPKNSIPNEALGDYFESFKQSWECDKIIDLCESIEVNLALYPSSPRYKYTKQEKYALCDKNYYEETFKIAQKQLAGTSTMPLIWQEKPQGSLFLPEVYIDASEEKEMQTFIRQFKDKFVIIWGLSGSARCKTYPYVEEVMQAAFKQWPDVVFITVGDEICQVLEKPLERYSKVIRKSGQWSIRQSILACKYANLVIAPDTGILHGAGCFDTPKIGLLTHSTIVNITKYFKNDYSIECDHDLVSCSPCFQLHYVSKISCNFGIDGYTPLCMAVGLPINRIIEQIKKVRQV